MGAGESTGVGGVNGAAGGTEAMGAGESTEAGGVTGAAGAMGAVRAACAEGGTALHIASLGNLFADDFHFFDFLDNFTLNHLKMTKTKGFITVTSGIITRVAQMRSTNGYSSHINVMNSRTDDGTKQRRLENVASEGFAAVAELYNADASPRLAFDSTIICRIR